MKPCHACCAHGYPSKCVYESVPDEEARPISQAEEIRNLRDEIKDLRNRINDRQDGTYKAPSPTPIPSPRPRISQLGGCLASDGAGETSPR